MSSATSGASRRLNVQGQLFQLGSSFLMRHSLLLHHLSAAIAPLLVSLVYSALVLVPGSAVRVIANGEKGIALVDLTSTTPSVVSTAKEFCPKVMCVSPPCAIAHCPLRWLATKVSPVSGVLSRAWSKVLCHRTHHGGDRRADPGRDRARGHSDCTRAFPCAHGRNKMRKS